MISSAHRCWGAYFPHRGVPSTPRIITFFTTYKEKCLFISNVYSLQVPFFCLCALIGSLICKIILYSVKGLLGRCPTMRQHDISSLKGQFTPNSKLRNFPLPVVQFVCLDCFGVSCRVLNKCLPSLEYNRAGWHSRCGAQRVKREKLYK